MEKSDDKQSEPIKTVDRDSWFRTHIPIKDSGFFLKSEVLFEELKQIIDNDRDELVKIMSDSEG